MAREFGLLVIRVSLGFLMIAHGIPKFLGGSKQLEWLGEQMGHFGITMWPIGEVTEETGKKKNSGNGHSTIPRPIAERTEPKQSLVNLDEHLSHMMGDAPFCDHCGHVTGSEPVGR